MISRVTEPCAPIATPSLFGSDPVARREALQLVNQNTTRKPDRTRRNIFFLGRVVQYLGSTSVPAWFLDTDYNGLCFHVCQAFFLRTSAWDNLKKALKGTYDDTVWDHLAGTTSTPFEPGEHRQVAVKVIDDRGNELLVVKALG
jgi:hypothetical protein